MGPGSALPVRALADVAAHLGRIVRDVTAT